MMHHIVAPSNAFSQALKVTLPDVPMAAEVKFTSPPPSPGAAPAFLCYCNIRHSLSLVNVPSSSSSSSSSMVFVLLIPYVISYRVMFVALKILICKHSII